MAAELVQAVREYLADEVAKVIGGRNGHASAKVPVSKAPNGVKTRRRKGINEGVLDQLLKVVKA